MKHRYMNRIAGTIAVASFGLLSAGFAQAHLSTEEERAMDRCIQEFLGGTLPGFSGKVSVRKESGDVNPVYLGSDSYQVQVSAVNRTTGKYVGGLVCAVSRDGTVTPVTDSEKLSGVAKPATVVAHNASR